MHVRTCIVYRLQVSDMRGRLYEKAGRCDYFFKLDANHVVRNCLRVDFLFFLFLWVIEMNCE
jgi:hypothetical protein